MPKEKQKKVEKTSQKRENYPAEKKFNQFKYIDMKKEKPEHPEKPDQDKTRWLLRRHVSTKTFSLNLT